MLLQKKTTIVTHHCFPRSIIAIAIAGLLTACGGTGQDQGQVSSIEQRYGGLVIDGYLARATVFIDTNNDGTRNSWEPYAFTDNEGYYSYNPNSGTDYCAPDASAQHRQYCLSSAIEYRNVVIRVDGGYDVSTGEPFFGQLSRRLSGDSHDDTIVSPITSLLSGLPTDAEQASLLTQLGLTESDLDVDYLNTDDNGGIDASLLNISLTMHKTVSVLSDRLTDTYTEIGDNFGTPNDATSVVYPALADMISESDFVDLEDILNTASLVQVLDQAEDDLRKVYENRGFDLPADLGDATLPGLSLLRAADVASDIPAVIDALIDKQNNALTHDEVSGRTRALESLVIKTINESASEDDSIENAVDFYTANENEPLIGALVDGLSADTVNFNLLTKNNFDSADIDTLIASAQSAATLGPVVPFGDMAGSTLRLSRPGLGRAPDKLDDFEIEIYFNGAAGDQNGHFNACLKAINNAHIDGTLGEGSTRGEAVTGFWSLFGARDGKSRSLLLTIDFLGTTKQGIIKAAGSELVDGVSYQSVQYDYDGDLQTWHSLNGVTQGGVPATTSAECESRLPSRIGI